MLSTNDHRRDSAGLRYVYPVVSRRAGGVSVGINLNVNNACNWACVYCQVEGLVRGGPPSIELDRLELELATFLENVVHGDFMARQVPEGARRLVDVAFSGNGEPTSAAEFARAVDVVGRVLAEHGLLGTIPLRLITNGSLLHRPQVQQGIGEIGRLGGEVWFKLDRASAEAALLVNGVPQSSAKVARNLALCADLAPTWVQTCWFSMDGVVPSAAERAAYCELLQPLASKLAGVHLYGLARPSCQPAASRLTRLSAVELAEFADEITNKTGVKVNVSP
jgi:wyosine [tRNA(Phe)-imidazoG37] synthetase (radical SAM superfamily)